MAKKQVITFVCRAPGCGSTCEFTGEVSNPKCRLLRKTTNDFQIVEVRQSLWQRFIEWLKKGDKN
jgi:bacteriorhodopsin